MLEYTWVSSTKTLMFMPLASNARQCLEADVEHRAVAADAPDRLVVPAHLVPAHPHADGVGRSVFKERVGPGDEIRVVRIGRGVDGVAPGRGHDAPLIAVLRAGRGAEHPQRRPFTAAGARSGAAGVEQGLLLEHHVDQEVVVDVLVVARPEVLEEPMALARFGHQVVALDDHLERVVVADRDALGAPLALAGVDDDVEHPAGIALLLGRRRSTSWCGTTGRGTFRDRPRWRCPGASSSSSFSERTLPRIAVSGHSVTQSMQPVQFSGM